MNSGISLTLWVGAVVPARAPAFLVDALTGVRVVIASRVADPLGQSVTHGQSGFELSFALPPRSPVADYFASRAGGSPPLLRVVLTVTLDGRDEVVIDGFVLQHEVQPVPDEASATLTVRGRDLTTAMDLVDRRGIAFPTTSVEGRVATILARYAPLGIVPRIVPTLLPDQASSQERVCFQDGTDYQYLCRLAENVGHVFYLEPGDRAGVSTAYWGPEIKLGRPQPALSLDWDAMSNVTSLSFAFNNATATEPSALVREQARTGPQRVPSEQIHRLRPALALDVPRVWRVDPLTDVAKLSVAAARLRTVARSETAAECVAAQGTLDVARYGRLLKARQLVAVRGAGPQHNGLYYVRSVTHEIRRGTYQQSFQLTRGGLTSTLTRVSR